MRVRTLYRSSFSEFLCGLLAIVMATTPSLTAVAQPPSGNVTTPTDQRSAGLTKPPEQLQRGASDTTLLAAPGAGKFDLGYVSPQAIVVAAIRPRQLLTSAALSLAPVEVVAAAGLQYLGFDPADFDQVTVFSELPLGGPPNYGVIIKFAEPFKMKSIPSRLTAHTQPGTLDN